VTALVGKNPETSTEKTLDDGIQCPQCRADWRGGNVLGSNKFVEQEECGCQTGDIPSHVAQPSQSRSLEAVLGNGISNVINSEVGQLELVAVGIDELSIWLLIHIVQRGH